MPTPTPADLDYQDGNGSSRDHAPGAGSALETARTPGPWRSIPHPDAACMAVGVGDDFDLADAHVTVWDAGCGRAKADAHLIAAAPDLLEALKPLAYGWTYGVEDAHREALKAARLAIAKAEGRS